MGGCVSNPENSPVVGGRRDCSYNQQPSKPISSRKSFQESTGDHSHKIQNFSCQLCFLPFNGQQRPPLLLCKNEHNACRNCVNSFYSNKVKDCPFCHFTFKLIYNEELLQMIQSYQGVYNKSMQLKHKPKANRDLKQETYWRAKKCNYKDVLEKLQNPQKQPIEQVTSIHQKLSNVSAPIDLSIFANLNKLEITYTELKNVEYFGCLPQLRVLNLCSNKICKIDPLYSYYRLQSLSLEFNQIQKIDNLQVFSLLKELNLEYNNITKIENLNQLKSLQILKLGRNKIPKIENLTELQELTCLKLDQNQITKIQGLQTLQKLQHLNLSSNFIAKIEGINKITKLKKLWLSSNKIQCIEPLCEISSLSYVDITNNMTYKKQNSLSVSTLKYKMHVQVVMI